jgi:hypothetical protein
MPYASGDAVYENGLNQIATDGTFIYDTFMLQHLFFTLFFFFGVHTSTQRFVILPVTPV